MSTTTVYVDVVNHPMGALSNRIIREQLRSCNRSRDLGIYVVLVYQWLQLLVPQQITYL